MKREIASIKREIASIKTPFKLRSIGDFELPYSIYSTNRYYRGSF